MHAAHVNESCHTNRCHRADCISVRCSVLQCFGVCCSVSQCVAVFCEARDTKRMSKGWMYVSVVQCVAMCCSVLQCVTVWCSMLQRVAACCESCYAQGKLKDGSAVCWDIVNSETLLQRTRNSDTVLQHTDTLRQHGMHHTATTRTTLQHTVATPYTLPYEEPHDITSIFSHPTRCTVLKVRFLTPYTLHCAASPFVHTPHTDCNVLQYVPVLQ